MSRLRFASGIVGCLALALFALAALGADGALEPATASQAAPAMKPLPAEPEPWLLPEPIQLSCTASFTCPDGSFIQCTDPSQCFVYAYICAIRCGNNNVVKCNNWPASCKDPCAYSDCIGQGGSPANCEDLHCTDFGGPD
jgi:hypothetical protein